MQIKKRVERREKKKTDMVPCHVTEMPGEQEEMVLSFLLHLLPPVLLCEVQEGFNEVMVWGGFLSFDK